MKQLPASLITSRLEVEPDDATNVDRVRASLASGGCATAHFKTDAEFRAARAALRGYDTRTRFGGITATGWRA